MTDLINRLEAGEGSRELSDAVLTATGWSERRLPMDSVPYWMHPSHPGVALSVAEEAVTTSLDAALALAERVLPGWKWSLGGERDRVCATDDPRPFATLIRQGERVASEGYSTASAATPALALCIAILRASAPSTTEAVGMDQPGSGDKR